MRSRRRCSGKLKSMKDETKGATTKNRKANSRFTHVQSARPQHLKMQRYLLHMFNIQFFRLLMQSRNFDWLWLYCAPNRKLFVSLFVSRTNIKLVCRNRRTTPGLQSLVCPSHWKHVTIVNHKGYVTELFPFFLESEKKNVYAKTRDDLEFNLLQILIRSLCTPTTIT